MERSPSWEYNRFSASQEIPAFYGTRRLITAYTSACQLSLSRVSSIQSIPPHPTFWRSILILSSHLRLGFPGGVFPPGFLTKTPYTPLLRIPATCPAHLMFPLSLFKHYLSEAASFCFEYCDNGLRPFECLWYCLCENIVKNSYDTTSWLVTTCLGRGCVGCILLYLES